MNAHEEAEDIIVVAAVTKHVFIITVHVLINDINIIIYI